MNTEKHPFEPFLPEGARILFLGSFPPQEHRWCMPFYYPNWINDFWRIMGLIHFGDKEHFCVPGEKRFDEEAIREFCTREGLAFYDTATEVKRLKDNASDAFLEVVTPTDIRALLARIPECHTLVTTGEKASQIAAETFGCRVPSVGEYIEIPDQVRNEEKT
ncbi:MAG: uracil-DNA glycosylase family protein, partial [Bacteroidales bacterium]|nr:uracil-DNA glycosylase family protein [Bacteroidales bacterium]